MKIPRTTKNNHSVRAIAAFAMFAALPGAPVRADEAGQPSGSAAAPCAVLDHFDGDVQILDSTRQDLVFTTLHAGVPCGGWVTVRQGWAQLRHKDGHVIKVGPDTFFEVFDPTGNPAGKSAVQVTLYRGRVWVDVPGGTPTVRIATANGIAAIARGTALVAYNQAEEETQVLSFRDKASLMNRFLTERPIEIHAGEMTALNLKLMRVVPTAAAPVAVASVKQMLAGMPVDGHEREFAIAAVQQRLDRKFAQQPHEGRAIASTGEKGSKDIKGDRYSRYPASEDQDQSGEGHAEWMNHLTGGEAAGERMLSPSQPKAKRKIKRGSVIAVDPALEADRKHFKEEQAEKKELIDALSKIRTE